MKELAEIYSYRPRMSAFLSRLESKTGRTEEKREILPGELFLGFSSPEFSTKNVVAPRLDLIVTEGGRRIWKPMNMLFLGPPGAGKSGLMSVVGFNNIIRRYDVYGIIPDLSPNPEWHLHKDPITKMLKGSAAREVEEFLTQFHDEKGEIRPEGYPGIVYKPASSARYMEKGIDKELSISLPDVRALNYFNPDEGIATLLTLTGLKDSHSALKTAESLIADEESKKLSSATAKLRQGKDESKVFLDRLEALLKGKILSDSESESQIIDDLAASRFLVFRQTTGNAANESIAAERNQTAFNVIMSRTANERRRFVSGTQAERMESKIRKPLVYLFDEMHKAAPREGTSYIRDIVDFTVLHERKNGSMVLGATQFPSKVSLPILNSARAIFVSGLEGDDKSSNDILDFLRSVGFANSIDLLTSMDQKVTTSIGTNVNQCAMLRPDVRGEGRITFFYPNISYSGIHFTYA